MKIRFLFLAATFFKQFNENLLFVATYVFFNLLAFVSDSKYFWGITMSFDNKLSTL